MARAPIGRCWLFRENALARASGTGHQPAVHRQVRIGAAEMNPGSTVGGLAVLAPVARRRAAAAPELRVAGSTRAVVVGATETGGEPGGLDVDVGGTVGRRRSAARGTLGPRHELAHRLAARSIAAIAGRLAGGAGRNAAGEIRRARRTSTAAAGGREQQREPPPDQAARARNDMSRVFLDAETVAAHAVILTGRRPAVNGRFSIGSFAPGWRSSGKSSRA
jgi:hypothetical protein